MRSNGRARGVVVALLAVGAVLALLGGRASAAASSHPDRSSGRSGQLLTDGWLPITSTGLGDTAQIGIARGRDGVLHVLWISGSSKGHYEIIDTPISSNGTVGKYVPVATSLDGPSAPAVVVTSTEVEAFWADTTGNVYSATRPLSGGSWTVHMSPPVLKGDPYAGIVGAAASTAGTAWLAFADANDCGGFCIDKVGSPQVHLPAGGGCCLSDANLAFDGSDGKMWLGFVADRSSSNSGLYVQPLTATGGSGGNEVQLPDTANLFSLNERMTISGRGSGHGGVYAGYTGEQHGTNPCEVHVLLLGTTTAENLGRNTSCSSGPTVVTADPNGRLWILWAQWTSSGTATLYYRRSNPAVTTWGPVEHIPFPSNSVIWSLYANAQPGRIDVVALLSPGYEYVTRQIIIPLSVAVGTGGNSVTFTVTDQGTAVPNATVTFCGKTAATGPSGHASFTVKSVGAGSAAATASKASYASTTVTVKATC
jgi:hypothetical protein